MKVLSKHVRPTVSGGMNLNEPTLSSPSPASEMINILHMKRNEKTDDDDELVLSSSPLLSVPRRVS